MNKKQKEKWEFAQQMQKEIKEDAIKNKSKYNDEIVCSICDKILGYAKEPFVEALCEKCSL